MLALEEHHLLGRGALVADDLAVGQLALGEDRRDIVEFLDLLGVHRQNVARRDQLLQAEIFGVENVEGIRLGDDALGDVVGRRDDVFDGDAGVRLHLLGDVVGLVHRGAEVAQHLFFRRPDGGKPGDGAHAGERPGALEHGATGDARATLCMFVRHGPLLLKPAPVKAPGKARECPRPPSAPRHCRRSTTARRRTTASLTDGRQLGGAAAVERRPDRCVPWYSMPRTVAFSRVWFDAGAVASSFRRSARTATWPAGVSMTLWPPRKRATNSVAGFSNTSRGLARLLDAALVHHHHEIGQRQRLVLAVRDVDERECRAAAADAATRRACARAGTDRAPTAARRAAGSADR